MNTSAAKTLRRFLGPAYGHATKRVWKALNARERSSARVAMEALLPRKGPLPFLARTDAHEAARRLVITPMPRRAHAAALVLTAPLRPEPSVKRKDDEGKVIKGWQRQQRAMRRAYQAEIAEARRSLA